MDKVSTPTPQIFDKGVNLKSLDDDDDNPPSDNLQQRNQTIPSKNPLDSKSDNSKNYHRLNVNNHFKKEIEWKKQYDSIGIINSTYSFYSNWYKYRNVL